MLSHRFHHDTEVWRIGGLVSRKDGSEIAEEPWAPETAAPNHDTIAAGLAHHAQRIPRFPDVAVAEDWNRRYGLLEFADCVPVGLAIVELGGGARVKRNGATALGFCDSTGVEKRHPVVVDAHPKLDRDGDLARRTNGCTNDRFEKSGFRG